LDLPEKNCKTRTQAFAWENKLIQRLRAPQLGAGLILFFASLFYVTQWVGRSNLTLLVENGPVFGLARRTLGYQFLVSAEEDVSSPGGKRVRADVHLVYRLGTDNCEFAYFVI